MRAYEDLRSSTPNDTSRFAELLSPALHANPQALLTDVETFSPTLDYMLELFLRPSGPRNITTEISPSYAASTTPADAIELERRTTQSGRYRALIFSTGAHFSDRHFNLPSTAAHLEYFDLVVSTFLDKVADALEKASGDERRDKEVIIRPTSNGHDDCHAAKGPLKDVDRNKSSMYSWKDMWDMNDRAEVRSGGVGPFVRSKLGALTQSFSPGRLSCKSLRTRRSRGWTSRGRRPSVRTLYVKFPSSPARLLSRFLLANHLADQCGPVFVQHTNDDCLHLSMGTGVVEGWTRYLAYWLREKASADDSVGRSSALFSWWPWRR